MQFYVVSCNWSRDLAIPKTVEKAVKHYNIFYKFSLKFKGCKLPVSCWIGTIRIKELKRAFKSGDLRSKLVYHALETDHVPNFEWLKYLHPELNYTNQEYS